MTEKQARNIADDMLEVGHFLFDGASWAFYEYILERRELGGHHARITYDRGQMEVQTGADVQGALSVSLPRCLRAFELEPGVPVGIVNDLSPTDDAIYVISGRLLEQNESPHERALELGITRSRIEPNADGDGGVAIPGELRLRGVVRAVADGDVLMILPGSVKFPGVEVARYFDFVYAKKGKKKA